MAEKKKKTPQQRGKAAKRKGRVGEAELAKKLREHGYDCRRTAQYCGKSGDASDVVGLPGIHIECKRVEALSLYTAMAQAKGDHKEGTLPAVFHRRNNCEWLVIMTLDDWMEIYREWEAGRNADD